MMIEWKVGKYKMQNYAYNFLEKGCRKKSRGGEGGETAYERGGDARRLT